MLQLRSSSRLRVVVSVLLVGVLWAPAVQAETLRVCADPDNMPFSSNASGENPGVYVELAQRVGKQLNMDVEFHWWLTVNQRRAMRYTIKEKKCDVVFAVPATSEYEMGALKRTNPFLNLSYALVAGQSFKFTSLDDLKNVRLGVQYQTPPHLSLTVRGGYDVITRARVSELYKALENKEIDAFFAWGPVAGYENKTVHDGRWKLTPVSGDTFEGEVAVAVHQDKPALVDSINGAFEKLKPEIEELTKKYAFPAGSAVDIEALSLRKSAAIDDEKSYDKAAATPHVQVADASDNVGKESKTVTDAIATDAIVIAANSSTGPGPDPKDPVAKQGRVKFNDICSHCHSADGASPEKRRDLRLLKTRYGEEWPQTAEKIMNEGLLDYGMPSWKGVLDDQDFVEILAFLKAIQE